MVLLGASYAASWGAPELPGLNILNMGRSGEDTSQLLARFDEDVISKRPEAVLIWGHINDIFRSPNGDMAAAAERAKRNHSDMIRRAEQAGIDVILATEVTLSKSPGLVNWAKDLARQVLGRQSYQQRVNTQVRAVNDFLRAEAARKGWLLLDLEKAVDDGDGYRRPEYSAEDGSHITPAGYAALTAYATGLIQAYSSTER